MTPLLSLTPSNSLPPTCHLPGLTTPMRAKNSLNLSYMNIKSGTVNLEICTTGSADLAKVILFYIFLTDLEFSFRGTQSHRAIAFLDIWLTGCIIKGVKVFLTCVEEAGGGINKGLGTPQFLSAGGRGQQLRFLMIVVMRQFRISTVLCCPFLTL